MLSALFVLNTGCQSLQPAFKTNKSKEKPQYKKSQLNSLQAILKINLTVKPSDKKSRNPATSNSKNVQDLAANNPIIATPFWKAEKDNQIFYMLGTIHLGVSIEDFQCSKIIQDKIKETNLLFVENFNPGTEYIYNNFKNAMRKLYFGSKEEKEQIMSQLSEETKKHIKNRMNVIKLISIINRMTLNINQGNKLLKDEGQFKELSKESQHFLIQHNLQDENKNYLDYYFDIFFIAEYDAFFSHKKYLDAEITKLALDYNIPIESLDTNKNTISDLEKEIGDLHKMEGQNVKVRSKDIDQIIANYNNIKQQYLDSYSPMISNYKSMDWKSQTEWFGSIITKLASWIFGSSDALLKNRNEAWIEKMLLSGSENQSIFIAAGYAHFTGSDNVLNLLEDEDFEITLIDEENCQF